MNDLTPVLGLITFLLPIILAIWFISTLSRIHMYLKNLTKLAEDRNRILSRWK